MNINVNIISSITSPPTDKKTKQKTCTKTDATSKHDLEAQSRDPDAQ